MSDLIERKRVDELVEYLDDLMEHNNAQLVHDMAGRIAELEKGEASLLQTIKDWQKAYAELQTHVERLESALETYADPTYWNKDGTHAKGLGPGIAKRALAAVQEDSDE